MFGYKKPAEIAGGFLGFRIISKKLAGSYWFKPVLLLAAGLIISRAMLLLDEFVHDRGYSYEDIIWVLKLNDPVGVSSALSGMATALLGLFGVLLSLALIPLSIAASQYGNVVIRNFLRDKGTQNVIAYFSFVIFYDLAAAYALPHTVSWDNYPGITLTIGYFLVFGALIATIYLFSHVANLLQATHITKAVSDELLAEIDAQYGGAHTEISEEAKQRYGELRQKIENEGTIVRSTDSGYVTGLSYPYLFKLAHRAKGTILVLKLPGDYVSNNEPLVRYVAAGRVNTRRMARRVNAAYSMGIQRTVLQDVDYGVTLLMIIAAKALSPAVNDPITAVICIDKIGECLSKVAATPTRSSFVPETDGTLRLIADPDDFERLMATGFNQIRQYGCHQYEIVEQQLASLETIAYASQRPADRKLLKYHADLILKDALAGITSEWSREQVQKAYNSAVKVIGIK